MCIVHFLISPFRSPVPSSHTPETINWYWGQSTVGLYSMKSMLSSSSVCQALFAWQIKSCTWLRIEALILLVTFCANFSFTSFEIVCKVLFTLQKNLFVSYLYFLHPRFFFNSKKVQSIPSKAGRTFLFIDSVTWLAANGIKEL